MVEDKAEKGSGKKNYEVSQLSCQLHVTVPVKCDPINGIEPVKIYPVGLFSKVN